MRKQLIRKNLEPLLHLEIKLFNSISLPSVISGSCCFPSNLDISCSIFLTRWLRSWSREETEPMLWQEAKWKNIFINLKNRIFQMCSFMAKDTWYILPDVSRKVSKRLTSNARATRVDPTSAETNWHELSETGLAFDSNGDLLLHPALTLLRPGDRLRPHLLKNWITSKPFKLWQPNLATFPKIYLGTF